MTSQAQGTFVVKLDPQPPAEGEETTVGRLTVEKQFMGDLVGTSKGQMLSVMTTVENSAGYVLIERVEGRLHGKRGTFVLQHFGIMDRGGGELTIIVVPDSATEELAGLSGTLTIEVVDGEHRYAFEYSLG